MEPLKDVDEYVDAWTRTMLEIWREKIERLHVVYTGHLHQSFQSSINATAHGTSVSMRFAYYGIYQALGVGKGYTHGNGGDLKFLDQEYRQKHRYNKRRKVGPGAGGYLTSGKPRKVRDWYSKKLYMSLRAIVEDLARICADNATSILCSGLSDVRSTLR